VLLRILCGAGVFDNHECKAETSAWRAVDSTPNVRVDLNDFMKLHVDQPHN
jgi:hypothetical protein